jgi:hypothetical protein
MVVWSIKTHPFKMPSHASFVIVQARDASPNLDE